MSLGLVVFMSKLFETFDFFGRVDRLLSLGSNYRHNLSVCARLEGSDSNITCSAIRFVCLEINFMFYYTCPVIVIRIRAIFGRATAAAYESIFLFGLST